jgi:hypothetical protein
MSFSSFFERLGKPVPFIRLNCFKVVLSTADETNHEVHYLQSQNGNIYRSSSGHPAEEEGDDTEAEEAPELAILQDYIEPEVEFMSKALGTPRSRSPR